MTRIIACLVLVCGFAIGVADAATLGGQVACSAASSTAPTCTLTGVQAGDLLVVGLAIDSGPGGALTGVSDPTNGAWTCPAGANFDWGFTNLAAICYKENSGASASLVVTAAISVAGSSQWNVSRWSGILASGSADGTGSEGSDTTSPYGHGAGLTTTGNGLIITAAMANNTVTSPTPASGFTALTNNGGKDYFQYRTGGVTTTDGAYTASTMTGHSGVMFAWLDGAGGAAAASPMLSFFGKRIQP